jgi:methionyl-tRNA synthetase
MLHDEGGRQDAGVGERGKNKTIKRWYSLREPQILFRKIEDEEIAAQLEKLKAKSKKVEESKNIQPEGEGQKVEAATTSEVSTIDSSISAERKPEIVFDDFAKIDLKVGTILSAEK